MMLNEVYSADKQTILETIQFLRQTLVKHLYTSCTQSNDSARSLKVQELISTLQQSALAGFCSVQSQQCSYDITNPSFDCSDGPESDTVTFTATVELQSSEGSITADDAVALIDNWKVYNISKSQVLVSLIIVTLNFRELTVGQ